MSLEAVVEDIREEAEQRATEIREAAAEEADEIIAEAESDAEEILSEAEEDVERRIERLREQELSSATLAAKQERLGARRDVLEDVRADVETAIAELSGERRETLTRILLEAGSAEFDEDATIEIYGRADDEDLLSALAAEDDRRTVAGTVECLGGVVLESEGARIRVNNTFDSILETVWEDELKEISDRLFSE